jgi:hypothetical protein
MTPPVNLEEIIPDGLPTRQQAGDATGTHRPGKQS